MAEAKEELIKEGFKYKSLRYPIAIIIISVALFVFSRMSRNNTENKPLFDNFTPAKSAEKGITGNGNMQADKMEKVNSTQGNNSPINTGSGNNINSSQLRKNVHIDAISKQQIIAKNVNTGANNSGHIGDENIYTGIQQRHPSNHLIEDIEHVCPDKQKKIIFLTPDGDQEAIVLADEIIEKLNNYGYKNMTKSWHRASFTANLNSILNIGFQRNLFEEKDGIFIGSASNLKE